MGVKSRNLSFETDFDTRYGYGIRNPVTEYGLILNPNAESGYIIQIPNTDTELQVRIRIKKFDIRIRNWDTESGHRIRILNTNPESESEIWIRNPDTEYKSGNRIRNPEIES